MPQKILGSSARQLNDINLAKGPEGVGDSLSVHLSQDPQSAAVWSLQVFVHIDQGTYFLGSITTTPPSAGNVPSRTVLIATCPAATGWKVIATCPTDGEEADLALDSSKCCTSAIGVRKLDNGGGGADQDVVIVGPSNLIDPWLNTWSVALANTFLIKGSAGTIRNLTLRVDSTLASGTYYLQVWDMAAVPANGVAVTLANGIDAPLKIVHVLGTDDLIVKDWSELGVDFDNGACLNLSSTEFTKTLVAGAFCSVIGAEYR